jgi:hypothetical protein
LHQSRVVAFRRRAGLLVLVLVHTSYKRTRTTLLPIITLMTCSECITNPNGSLNITHKQLCNVYFASLSLSLFFFSLHHLIRDRALRSLLPYTYRCNSSHQFAGQHVPTLLRNSFFRSTGWLLQSSYCKLFHTHTHSLPTSCPYSICLWISLFTCL